MPKNVDVRLIDTPYDTGLRRTSGSTSGGSGGGGGGGDVPSPHDLSGVHHTGSLDWADLNKTGSDLGDLASRSHSDLTGVNPNDHHNQVHTLTGSDHTATGLTTGHVVRASGSTTFAWAQLQHNDLGGVTADQHHTQIHSITGSDHTITGSQYQLVGATGTNTLGLLTPSSSPGAAAAILRTDSNGGLALDTALFVVDGSANTVTIDTNVLYADAPNNRVGINQTPGNAALDVMVSATADHTLRVKQKSGQSGRLWRVEDTAGDELIVLDSVGNLQSGQPGFVSGLTGWQITPTGTAEFNNVWVRGELHATIFVKDEVHVSGGTLLVANGGKLFTDADIDTTTVDLEELEIESSVGGFGDDLDILTTEVGFAGTTLFIEATLNYIEVEDSPTGPGLYFQPGDVVRSKTEVDTGVTDFWFTIRNGEQKDGYQRYSVDKESGTDGILPAGAALADYGVEGDGRILLTSDLNYAPYMDVFTVGPAPWTGAAGAIIPHVRLGRLDGVGVTGTSGVEQYGIIAGTDLSNANSPYAILSNLQLRLHRVDYTANDGSNDTVSITATGNVTVGTNVALAAGKAFSVQTTGTDAGDVIVGDHTLVGNYMRWDKSASTLTINGALSVGGVGVATTGDVSAAIVTADTNAAAMAVAAAGSAFASAQVYGNARRVVGVSGTFTSTDADTITWTSVSIRFGDARTETVTNGNTGNMGARTYLYVDATASSPLTLSATTSLSSITGTHALIAVCDPGTEKASISIVAGSTYISGDNIITGSIVAANIKAATITATQIAAGAITATKISVTDLAAVNTSTGALSVTGNIDVGTTGAIRGNAKAYGSATAGFFLGYHSSAYKFDVGDNNNFIRWDGSNLQVSVNNAIGINMPAASGTLFNYATSGGTTRSMTYTEATGELNLGAPVVTGVGSSSISKFVGHITTGDTLTIQTKRTPASAAAAGLQGEICWDNNYMYVYIGASWRRISLAAGGW